MSPTTVALLTRTLNRTRMTTSLSKTSPIKTPPAKEAHTSPRRPPKPYMINGEVSEDIKNNYRAAGIAIFSRTYSVTFVLYGLTKNVADRRMLLGREDRSGKKKLTGAEWNVFGGKRDKVRVLCHDHSQHKSSRGTSTTVTKQKYKLKSSKYHISICFHPISRSNSEGHAIRSCKSIQISQNL
jgi:hypothetical protein